MLYNNIFSCILKKLGDIILNKDSHNLVKFIAKIEKHIDWSNEDGKLADPKTALAINKQLRLFLVYDSQQREC